MQQKSTTNIVTVNQLAAFSSSPVADNHRGVMQNCEPCASLLAHQLLPTVARSLVGYAVVFCRDVEKLLYLVAANSWCDQYLLLCECICAIMTLTHTNFGRESLSFVVFYEFIYLNLLTNLELKLKYTWSNIL